MKVLVVAAGVALLALSDPLPQPRKARKPAKRKVASRR